MALISVVLSAYNAERYIFQAIDSIFNQTYKNFEFVVIDDGSFDGTKDILDNFDDPRLIKITNKTNIGLTNSLIKGVSFTRGTYIARQDADDLSHPDRLRQQLDFMEAYPEVGLLGSAYRVIDESGQKLDDVYPPQTNSEIQKQLELGNIFCHGSVMIRRSVFDRVNGYREQFPITQDYDLWLRIAEVSELANLNSQLYNLRFHPTSISRKKIDVQLAYRRLAWELALQRRTIGKEFLLPDKVSDIYPPEPWRLLKAMLGIAFLFYIGGRQADAAEQILNGYNISKKEVNDFSWTDWCSASARRISELRNSIRDGSEFIAWLYNLLPSSAFQENYRKTMSDFFADQAFQSYQKGQGKNVLLNSFQTIKYDINKLRNRGLWRIVLESSGLGKPRQEIP